MTKNDVVLKAKQLDEIFNCDGVVELLSEYVKENANDLEAFALYQKNFAIKIICDMGISIDEIVSVDETVIFKKVPENKVLDLAKLLFTEEIATVYLIDKSADEKELLIRGYIRKGISSLGERLNDYNVFKNLLDEFYNITSCYGFEKRFYTQLAYIVEWKSKVDENILCIIVEAAKTKVKVATDKEIYDEYVKDLNTNVFPYDEKPDFYGGKVVIVNIKTQEQADFWKGYFAFVKKVRQEEYEEYKKNISDKNQKGYELYSIGELLHQIAINLAVKQVITSADIAKMGVATQYDTIGVSESDYTSVIEAAEKSYNTVKVNPIEQIKSMIFKLFGKK